MLDIYGYVFNLRIKKSQSESQSEFKQVQDLGLEERLAWCASRVPHRS